MHRPTAPNDSRRRFLKLSGSALVLIPLTNLYGCSDKADSPPPQPPAAGPASGGSATAPAQQEPASVPEQPAASPAPAMELVRVDETDATATALGYRHAASEVDAEKYPRYAVGQLCENCSLYQLDGGSEDGWSGCSIFPGKLVNANGWCSAYVPKA